MNRSLEAATKAHGQVWLTFAPLLHCNICNKHLSANKCQWASSKWNPFVVCVIKKRACVLIQLFSESFGTDEIWVCTCLDIHVPPPYPQRGENVGTSRFKLFEGFLKNFHCTFEAKFLVPIQVWIAQLIYVWKDVAFCNMVSKRLFHYVWYKCILFHSLIW